MACQLPVSFTCHSTGLNSVNLGQILVEDGDKNLQFGGNLELKLKQMPFNSSYSLTGAVVVWWRVGCG